MHVNRKSRLTEREDLKGYLFLIPLFFGLILFFIIPVVKSFLFSVTNVSFGQNGYSIGEFSGFDYYAQALLRHTKYGQTVASSMLNMLLTAPLIMIFSFFMASVLSHKFRGRTFFKVVMFIPVVTALAATETSLESLMNGFSSYKDTVAPTAVSFTHQISTYLQDVGLNEQLAQKIVEIADAVYGVIDASGIQILVMIVGMCSISPSLYEAATVEGATAWESFWKITFPMAGPTIYTCLIYTIIDSFTDSSNGIMSLISQTSMTEQQYSLASAMGWIYFAIIGVLLGLVAALVSRFLFYYDK